MSDCRKDGNPALECNIIFEVVVLSKLAVAALVASLVAFVSAQEADAQKGVGVKVNDGITVKDTKKAKLEANTSLNEGDKLRVANQLDQAVQKYQKALRAYPMEADIYKNLGGTYAQMGKFQEAESTLKQGTKLFPKEWLMWNNYAVVLLNLNKKEECKAAIKQAMSCHPPSDKVEEMNITLKTLEGTKSKTATK
jgi:Flp pilus assembly protein TadD